MNEMHRHGFCESAEPVKLFVDKYIDTHTEEYKFCNHHHKLDKKHAIVDFGDGKFVANNEAIPLLKALNEVGLRTRTHHIDGKENAFISILLDNAQIEIKKVFERDAKRTKYNGKTELLIIWNAKKGKEDESIL